ncbi:MAG TPA: S8 family serine peptidase, partial [Clostridia bacterium]|nr:S8 family serine peptidase [Clostridia bacterium]
MNKYISRFSLVFAFVFLFVMMTSGMVAGADTVNGKVKVIIEFDGMPGPAEQALVRAFGGEVDHSFTIVNAIAARVPENAIDGISRNPHVLAVEPDVKIYKSGEIDNVWGVLRIGSPEVHASGNTGDGIKVAVIDSGIDYNHPELDGNYVGGYDFVNEDTDPMDDEGHGTHVAGTIAAEANGVGVIGVA